MSLKALRPILLDNTQYEPGDTLPASNPALVDAWIECGSAEYREDTEPDAQPEPEKPKAKRRSAKAGRTGIAQPSSGPENDLVGQVPDPEARGVVKEPAKRPGRKSSA